MHDEAWLGFLDDVYESDGEYEDEAYDDEAYRRNITDMYREEFAHQIDKGRK